jgi:hypothetical protein
MWLTHGALPFNYKLIIFPAYFVLAAFMLKCSA